MENEKILAQLSTPKYISDLFSELANNLPFTKVLDPACGAPRGAIKQYLKGKEAICKVNSMPQYC